MIDALAALLFVLLIIWLLPGDRDDTDPPNGRSGMRLYIDARTGCHYLGQAFGSLTPRMDENGKHICDKRGGGQ